MPAEKDLVIIGAGAAGLAAAIFSAQTSSGLKLALLDGAKKIGAKILVSGGSRCNVTNANLHTSDFHGPARIIRHIIDRFDQHATRTWFEALHIPLKQEEGGKLFPVTNSSKTILNGLLERCQSLSIPLLTGHRVQSLQRVSDGFLIHHTQGTLTTRQVILATGGQSLPKTGSDGAGFLLAKNLGHTVTPCYPALVPLLLKDSFFHRSLAGVSHDVELTTRLAGKIVDRRSGSLLWTHFGISGPVVLDTSRFWVMVQDQEPAPEMFLNMFPDQTFSEIVRWLYECAQQFPRRTTARILAERLPARVAQALCSHLDRIHESSASQTALSDPPYQLANAPIGQLSRSRRRELVRGLMELPLPVIASRGWNFAEVTAGGVPLREIKPQTMESRKVPGLYLIGEILDCDGRIGGFNFQWAWSTGYIAGTSTAQKAI